IKGITKSEIGGSFRRRRETVGDLDLCAAANNKKNAIEGFLKFDGIARVAVHGATKASVFLHSGLQVDFRVVTTVSFGAALLYFTGSKPHNIALRALALAKKMKLNEYGLFRGKKLVAGKT